MAAYLLLLLLLLLLQQSSGDQPPNASLSAVAGAATIAGGDHVTTLLKPAASGATAGGSPLKADDNSTAGAPAAAPALHSARMGAAAAANAAAASAVVADAAADAAAAEAVDKLIKGRQPLPLTYESIVSLLPKLQRVYPHLIRIQDAAETFGLQDELLGMACGQATCRVPYIELGLLNELNRNTPAIFYSGLVHGDEVVGPTVSVYLVALLASQFATVDEVFYLLSNRLLVVFPFFNPWGFARQTRDERGIDPNRDFPYMNPACFSATTSRLVGAAFERYLFIGGITWHGGMRAIARPWGSFDHSEQIKGGFRSRPAPDDVALAMVGKWLQEAGGPSASEYQSPYLSEHFVALQRLQRKQQLQQLQEQRQRRGGLFGVFYMDKEVDDELEELASLPYFYYPEGPISDLVYPVNGGLEDWAYSAAFQASPNPISACLVQSRRPTRWLTKGANATKSQDNEHANEDVENSQSVEAVHGTSPRRLAASGMNLWKLLGKFWDESEMQTHMEGMETVEFNKSAVRCAMYLVEAHDDKNPPAKEYGKLPASLISPPSVQDGLIVRNARIAYKLAEKMQPDVLVLAAPASYQAPGCIANFAIWAVGCETLDFLRIVAKQGKCSDFFRKEQRPLPEGVTAAFAADQHDVYELTPAWNAAPTLNDEHIKSRTCRPVAPWQRPQGDAPEPFYRSWNRGKNEIYGAFSPAEREKIEFFRFKVPPETRSGEICIAMLGEFDKGWTEKVAHADPPLPPQSWLVESRSKKSAGFAPKGAGILKGGKRWIFPTRSPAFPGNPSPVGFTIQIREDSIEGFVSVSLHLPAPAADAETTIAHKKTPEESLATEADSATNGAAFASPGAPPATQEFKVSLTIGGFLNDDPLFFNPYTRFIEPFRRHQEQQEPPQQQQQLSLPGSTKGAADVVLRVDPKLAQFPDGLLAVRIERRDPNYRNSSSSSRNTSNNSSSSNIVHISTINTGSGSINQQQRQQELNRVLLKTDDEVRLRLQVPVGRLLGQRVVVTWIPASADAAIKASLAASTAEAAAAAATAAVDSGTGFSAAAPLVGSQHVPLLSDQVNEDFNLFLLYGGPKEPSSGGVRGPRREQNVMLLLALSRMFFPYTRSFDCIFSSTRLLPPVSTGALDLRNLQGRRAGRSSEQPRIGEGGSQDEGAPNKANGAPSSRSPINGKLAVTSVWTKGHKGVTSLVAEFSTQAETDWPLLLRFGEGCCVNLVLRRQANGWAFRAAFSTEKCSCGPGAIVTASLIPPSSIKISDIIDIGADEELMGAQIYSEEEAEAAATATAASAASPSYAVYAESPERRGRILEQLQLQQHEQQRELTPYQVSATVRRVAGVKSTVTIRPDGFWNETPMHTVVPWPNADAAIISATVFWGAAVLCTLLLLLSVILTIKRFGIALPRGGFVLFPWLRRRELFYEPLGIRPAETAEFADGAAPATVRGGVAPGGAPAVRTNVC